MNILRTFYSKLYRLHLVDSVLKTEKKFLRKYNGSFNLSKEASKLENRIRIGVHGIEKGFSFRNVKPSFGKEKILKLLSELDIYAMLEGHDDAFFSECLSTLSYYLEQFKDSKGLNEIFEKYEKLAAKSVCVVSNQRPAVLTVNTEDVDDILSKTDYESFISSRHSYRYYSDKPIDMDLLRKALKIAEHTPTACNRQAQKVYVFKGKGKDLLLNTDASRSFVSEIDTAILITVDMRAYFSNEIYQCYVDGGLYAMNLINAIHSTGLGCIPLTMSRYAVQRREEMNGKLGIPLNEAPIIAIGVGNREPVSRVNASYRKDYNSYTFWKI